MIDDMSDVISQLGTGTYEVTRYSSTTTGGRVSTAVASTFEIEAHVQPLTGREIDRLPELLRARETRAVFTTTALRTGYTGQQPDRITINGAAWEVEKVEPWDTLGGYHRAIVARVGR